LIGGVILAFCFLDRPGMNVEATLYKTAVELIEKRYPQGWGGAAAVMTASGAILTSVAPDTNNDALSLCMEVGAYLEAHKLSDPVTHSLCIYRDDEASEFIVLSPCGICRERLAYWGGDVLAAVTNPENRLVFKSIRELLPYHWEAVNGSAL
jgi:cytidine deaminase